MEIKDITKLIDTADHAKGNDLKEVSISESYTLLVYPNSIVEKDGTYLFIGKSENPISENLYHR